MTMKIKVAIVDDDKHYSNALKNSIDFDDDLECIGQIFNGCDATIQLQKMQPNVVLMDVKLPFKKGVDVLLELKDLMINTHFIICTHFDDDDHIFRSLKAGATGYLLKIESLEKIIYSIKEAHCGGVPMSYSIAKKVLHHFHDHIESKVLDTLTRSEKDILGLLVDGLQYKIIADKKSISIDTVKKHVGNIYRKLQVNNRIEAMKLYNKSNY